MIDSLRPRLLRPRATGLLAAALLVAGASYLSGLVPSPSLSEVGRGGGVPVVLEPVAQPASGPTELLMGRYERAIAAWNESLAESSANYIAATNLGTVYVGRARLTGDLGDYDRALTAADRALDVNPTYLPARELRATILFAIHDFRGARDTARAILADAPDQLQALATLGDASLELGDLSVARASYLELERQAASAPVWSRLSHLAFIEGDLDRAIGLVQRAVDAMVAEPASESTAFYAFQLGELYRARGDVEGAAAAYGRALADLPGHVPATAGLARVREAQGNRAEAIALLVEATDQIPQPELLAALGDLYELDGNAAAAERAYALVERIGAVATATGAVYNRQLVLFAADHDRDLAGALPLARSELQARTDVYAHDALAWILYKSGFIDEAAVEAAAALALGTPDPRIAYHAGLIAAAQGRTDDARHLLMSALSGAVFLPPLQVPVAEQALAALGGGASQ